MTNNQMINGKCSGCGNCCGNILPLSKTEIEIIRNYIKEHNISVKRSKDLITCPFRNTIMNLCTIYSIRPDICRYYFCDHNQISTQGNKRMLEEKRETIDMYQTFKK